jgi:hypothetical protein
MGCIPGGPPDGLTAGLVLVMPELVFPFPFPLLPPGETAPVLLGVAVGCGGESDGDGVAGGLLGVAGGVGLGEPVPGVADGGALDGEADGVGVADGVDGDGVGAGHARAGSGEA